jgi:hypothetical protein
MFFQSVYAQFTLSGVNAVDVTLYVNKNALKSTYLGIDATTKGNNIFKVVPMKI